MLNDVYKLGQKLGVRRLVMYAVLVALSVPLARFSPSLPLFNQAEQALYDSVTSLTAPPLKPDPRITLVTYDEDTLRLAGKRSPLDRSMLAKALTRLDALHPQAIGVDILLDQPQKDDDPALLAALKAMRTPTWIAYTPATDKDLGGDRSGMEAPWQQAFLDSVVRSVKGSKVGVASVAAITDSRDVIRDWATPTKGLARMAQAMAPGRHAFDAYDGPIRFRQRPPPDTDAFTNLPIQTFRHPERLSDLASVITGRYILIGSNIPGVDQYWTPLRMVPYRSAEGPDIRKVNGVEILAEELSQLLDDVRYRPIPAWAPWVVVVLALALGGATALTPMRAAFPIALATIIALMVLMPILLQMRHVDIRDYPMVGSVLAWFVGAGVSGSAARAVTSTERAYAQAALGKYLPTDIASEILRSPDRLRLEGERRDLFIIVTDLEGFTRLSETLEPEALAQRLNLYIECLSHVILTHGGTIDKFVGDSVIAFWGAPIARPNDGARAVSAAVALYEAGDAFRAEVAAALPTFGRTRVGLHYGRAVVGNFGGTSRIQYTALGDAMNTAQRLEAASKELGTSTLASGAALAFGNDRQFRAMGRIRVRGKSEPLDVFEGRAHFPQESRLALNTAVKAFYSGDVDAINKVAAMAAADPDDLALQSLVFRLRSTGPDQPFDV